MAKPHQPSNYRITWRDDYGREQFAYFHTVRSARNWLRQREVAAVELLEIETRTIIPLAALETAGETSL